MKGGREKHICTYKGVHQMYETQERRG